MDRSIIFEMPINVSSRHILYLIFSSFLSSLLLFEFPDTISRIEKEIGNDINENGSDGEIEIDDEMGDTGSRPRDRKYDYMRRKLQIIADVLSSVKWRLDHFFFT
jgi:hypothetical protein